MLTANTSIWGPGPESNRRANGIEPLSRIRSARRDPSHPVVNAVEAPRGLEPRYRDSVSRVLPLNDEATSLALLARLERALSGLEDRRLDPFTHSSEPWCARQESNLRQPASEASVCIPSASAKSWWTRRESNSHKLVCRTSAFPFGHVPVERSVRVELTVSRFAAQRIPSLAHCASIGAARGTRILVPTLARLCPSL